MTLDEIMSGIEACSLDPSNASLEEVINAVVRRAALIDALVSFDFTTVGDAERASARARLYLVLARDEELRRTLGSDRDALLAELDSMRAGRAAVRGYGAGEASGSGRFSGVG
jgi:hypothetical protein